jgi:hypothetical protein
LTVEGDTPKRCSTQTKHANSTVVTALALGMVVATARATTPRWVSAWGKCADEDAIVTFLSKPANTGVFKSLFL